MEINQEDWNNLFEVVKPKLSKPPAVTLDPLAELQAKANVQIEYKRKTKQNDKSAFMVIGKKQLNWLALLLMELKNAALNDRSIMLQTATARRGIGKGGSQQWETFVSELYTDKVEHRNDFSEGQLRHLPVLISLLSAGGFKFKGCGALEFIDSETGVVLA